MKSALVGYTGFVGTNLNASYEFDGLYNSKNVKDAYGLEPKLLVYSGLPAAMLAKKKKRLPHFPGIF